MIRDHFTFDPKELYHCACPTYSRPQGVNYLGISILGLSSFCNSFSQGQCWLGAWERKDWLCSSLSLLSLQNCPHTDVCMGVYACMCTNHRCAHSWAQSMFLAAVMWQMVRVLGGSGTACCACDPSKTVGWDSMPLLNMARLASCAPTMSPSWVKLKADRLDAKDPWCGEAIPWSSSLWNQYQRDAGPGAGNS